MQVVWGWDRIIITLLIELSKSQDNLSMQFENHGPLVSKSDSLLGSVIWVTFNHVTLCFEIDQVNFGWRPQEGKVRRSDIHKVTQNEVQKVHVKVNWELMSSLTLWFIWKARWIKMSHQKWQCGIYESSSSIDWPIKWRPSRKTQIKQGCLSIWENWQATATPKNWNFTPPRWLWKVVLLN
jgi:hypothetical protein